MLKNLLLLALTLALVTLVYSQSRNSNQSRIREEFLFPFQDEHVHGSSCVELPNGDLLAVWFQGSGERTADDVRVMGSRLKKGASVWSPVFMMADTKGIPDCNPALFLNQKGKLFLFWVAVQANQWQYSLLRFKTTTKYLTDGAPEWEWQDDIILKPDDKFAKEVEQKFKEMPENQQGWAAYAPKYDNMIIEASKDVMKRSFGWMTRIHPITLKSGRILLPLYSDGLNMSMVAISDDNGDTWRPSLPIVGRGPIQPALAIRKNGNITAYMRDSGDAPNRVWICTSADQGESWNLPVKTAIPNEASVEICVLKNGDWAFVGNDITDGRYQFSIFISEDEGATWKWKELIEYETDKKGSFSYPCLFQDKAGMLNLTYSYSMGPGKKSIKHVVIDPGKVKNTK